MQQLGLWHGKDATPSIRVLLGDPRWKARLLRFIEPSGVGRIVDEVEVEEERAVRLDGWVAWKAEERHEA